MKRVLSLVLALVLVLGMIPTFAADATGAQNLYDNGFITGKDGATVDAKLDVNAKLTRAELAALVAELNGAKEEAAAFAQPADFTDADTFQDWAKPFIAYAQENGWMNGLGDGTMFGPDQAVPANQLVAVLMNALGYDVTWNTVLADAAELGIIAEGTELTRGEAFEAMWTAVSAVNVNGEEMTLGVKLGKLEPEVVEPTELLVSDVVADNLKTLVINFNQAIDKDTVKATTVKVVEGTTDRVSAMTVSEDKMFVTVTLNTVDQSDSLKVTVEGVKNAAGEEVVKYEQTIVVNDTTVPTILSAVALNPKQIKVTFSEPVQAPTGSSPTLFTMLNDIKIDSNSIVAKAAVDNVDNTVLFTLSNTLTEGSKSIEIKGLKDYANFTAPTATLTFEVVKDDKAPVATSVEVKSMTSVLVKFDEPVEVAGTFKVDNGTAFTPAAADWNAQKTEVTLKGLSLGISAIVEVKVEYKGQKDIIGNEVKDYTTITTQVADDTTLPTVELTTVGANNKLTLTFSKPMQTVGKLQILDKDDKVVQETTVLAAGFKANSESKVIEWTVLASKNPGDYKVKITDMKDATVRQNGLATTTLSFTSLDTLKPEVSDKFLVTAGVAASGETAADAAKKDTVKIFFSEAMDKTTIENLANYQVKVGAGTFGPLQADSNATKIVAAADLKSVTITYTGAATATLEFKAVAVKDAAGNMITGAISGPILVQGSTFLNVNGNVLVKTNNTIQVTFNNEVAAVDPSVFVVYEGTEAVTGMSSAVISATDSKVVTFTTAVNLDADAEKYTLMVNAPTAIKNIYNSTLTKTGTTAYATAEKVNVIDMIAPTLTKVEKGTAPNSIKLTFSEPMKAGTEAAFKSNMLVKDTNGAVVLANANTSNVVIASNVVTVTFAGTDLDAIKAIGTNEDAEKTIKISFPVGTGILDTAATGINILPVSDQEVKVLVDTTAPTMVSAAVTTPNTHITVTFSESVTGTFAANDGGFVVTATGEATTYAVTSWAAGTNANQIVLTVATFAAEMGTGNGGITVTYATGGNASTVDLAGNALATNAVGLVIAE
ncbi:S-layer homology domain-containing protein [Fusibacter bizertensis]|uniref:S-layer homology domain-containing protein n=1 Tax=Fusibacter bizertensis TaxID=1488331 RepID=A0ABT6NFR0_9FIRM|nr:S-layer homology domain-containing protein [Fusibacter bizertensis]MDH8679254.1 S-layer homology domain-containing protein [Fusibacter bizertensis]